MKADRHRLILKIIALKDIETQHELVQELRNFGYEATQATVSRDIRELRLIKVAAENGGYRYAEPDKQDISVSDRMIRILSDSMIEVRFALNLVVVKTISGSANGAAEVIDSMGWSEILGTIAGDNTILIVTGCEDDASMITGRLERLAGMGNGRQVKER